MCLACLHPRQARKNVGEVFTNINFQAAAVFHDGVEDGAFAPGLAVSNEQPVFLAKLGRPDGVFNQVVVDLDPAVCQIPFEILPLIESVVDGFSQFASREYPALAEFDDEAIPYRLNSLEIGPWEKETIAHLEEANQQNPPTCGRRFRW